ncbi:exodeoxyribonuclease VII, large subunit [Pseudooceanicola batsensis HTCC2597]|uniref:Exodeoxyribonuclease 7 large subunit n=1 Tax=Pseudooceanicola batsensis (strain ATCC BAA-863 / DSM 15984 / KCTC 12145 / HTCC2597) TaxID=252305 RepID=A3TUK3_PSEBH|nr:exodeoxyribonuclease VII large subunit [Pseudooceanicola batsensis]EAQ04199.1 exodeoxyribonuclease VII, large subunit [Pseudooceanicola batsensis HTCC2597]
MDLIDDGKGGAGGNAHEFTVSELSGAVKRAIESGFGHVRVRAEVGRVSRPRSGHMYFDLKDDRAVLSAVSWKGQVARMQVQPEEGMEVIATGRMTTFPGQSKYQLIVDNVEPAGAGALMALLEKRKAMLRAEGLFAAERKRPLPYLPRVVGVVTSPSGAVIRDILHRLRDRFPVHVLIWPVAVQGQTCAAEVSRAIAGFNRLSPAGAVPRPDLLIVARGGGSIEDLWGFNEEIVARAAASSEIPLISAVGHETDTTLIDFVSDRRAPTPTAAAELAVPVRAELTGWVADMRARLIRAQGQAILSRRQRLSDLARALPRPERLTETARQKLDTWGERLPNALRRGVAARRVALSDCSGALRPGLLRRRIAEDRQRVADRGARLPSSMTRNVMQHRRQFETCAARLQPATLRRETLRQREALEKLANRFAEAARRSVESRRDRLATLDRLRETLGYRETLARGYAVVRDGNGAVMTRKAQAEQAESLAIEFADGTLDQGASPAPRKKPSAGRKEPPPEQGSLF